MMKPQNKKTNKQVCVWCKKKYISDKNLDTGHCLDCDRVRSFLFVIQIAFILSLYWFGVVVSTLFLPHVIEFFIIIGILSIILGEYYFFTAIERKNKFCDIVIEKLVCILKSFLYLVIPVAIVYATIKNLVGVIDAWGKIFYGLIQAFQGVCIPIGLFIGVVILFLVYVWINVKIREKIMRKK